jgi:hypothetical protein
MNSHLLSLVEYPIKNRPVMLDRVPAPENPDAGPFLVSSSKSVVWVPRAFPGGFLRVAVRNVNLDTLSREVVNAVVGAGEEHQWGNVQPATKSGVIEGMAHLHYYGLTTTCLLYGGAFDISIAPDLSRSPVGWLPPTWAVLVPSREYVGTAYLFGEGYAGALVHNPSRGMVVLKG